MLPQNTIHSARTRHDILNFFLFIRHDLLNLFLVMCHDLVKLSRQSITKFSTFSLSLSLSLSLIFRTIHQYVHVPSAWIDATGSGRRILQLFSAIYDGLLVPIFSAIHHDFLVPIFSAIHHDLLVPIFSVIHHDALVQFSR